MKQPIDKLTKRATPQNASRGDPGGRSADECADLPQSLSAIVVGCKRGDRESRSQLWIAYRRSVYALISRMVGACSAGDLTRDVFVQAFREIQQFDEQSTFDLWLLRIAAVTSLKHVSEDNDECFEEKSTKQNDTSASTDFEDTLLEQALQRLAPDQRLVILLRERFGLSYAEIAEVLQVPSETVGLQLSRGRQTLQAHLTDLGWKG